MEIRKLGVSGQLHTKPALFSTKMLWYLLNRRLRGFQSPSGEFETEKHGHRPSSGRGISLRACETHGPGGTEDPAGLLLPRPYGHLQRGLVSDCVACGGSSAL